MALTNYWWLLIWIFVGGSILAILVPQKKEVVLGKNVNRWRVVPAIALIVPYLVWATFRTDGWGDTSAYRSMFNNITVSISQISSYIQDVTKDRGFAVFAVIEKNIFGDSDVVFFFIIALIQLLVIALVLRKYSCDYWLSIFFFVASTDYMSWVHNGIRQFLAVTIIFAATGLMIKKKHLAVVLIIILATTIHASALIMLPIYFIVQGKPWNRRTILLLLASLVTILFIDNFTGILETMLEDTAYNDAFSTYAGIDDGVNPLRVLVYSVPTVLSLVGLKWIKREDDPLINFTVGCSICTTGLYAIAAFSSGILLGRLPIYTSVYSMWILLPWEIDHIFTKQSARLIKICSIVLFVIFFYYQMHYSWNLL